MTGADLVDIIIEAPEWETTGLDALAGRACAAALTGLGLDPDRFEIALLACDDARIAELNGDFRSKPTPTNVLSWPASDLSPGTPGAMPEKPVESPVPGRTALGDVAIALQHFQKLRAQHWTSYMLNELP